MKRLWPLLLFPLGYGLFVTAANRPELVEQVYSSGIYPHIARIMLLVTGLIPFSLAEVIGVLLIAGILAALVTSIFDYDWRGLGKIVLRVATGVATLYFFFVILWGLNYSRLPFGQTAGLNTENPSKAELISLCEQLITDANSLRTQVTEGSSGAMTLPQGVSEALTRVQYGYSHAKSYYPTLAGRYSVPKGVMASKLMSYTGTSGIFMPFTGEANVNILMPHSSIPFTAAHEVAHQHGYAREDEANFIAYLTCRLHPDRDFQYSGALHGMLYAMSALYAQDPEVHATLNATISASVKRDIQAQRDYWQAHEGIVERISNQMNDAYLRANRQQDGVASYGRMVDLLIAYFRALRA